MKTDKRQGRIASFKNPIILLGISFLLVFASLYLPKTVDDYNALRNISCGWPLAFTIFSSDYNPPVPWTKSCIGWQGSPMDSRATILWLPFFLNVVIVFIFITLLIKTYNLFLREKTKKDHDPLMMF